MSDVQPNKKNLIWIDLEMTGLDTQTDHILEIATIVTDSQLNLLAEGPVFAIHTPDSILNGIDISELTVGVSKDQPLTALRRIKTLFF